MPEFFLAKWPYFSLPSGLMSWPIVEGQATCQYDDQREVYIMD